MGHTVTAGMTSAFGRIVPVEIVEFDQDSETGEPVAAIITASGTRAVVKRSSLLPAPVALPEQYAKPTTSVTEPGMYRTADGTIYKVQAAKESGNLYAKRLDVIGGKRLVETGEKVHFDFEYAPGAVRDLRADERMTLDEAKAFGVEYGICCVCGLRLKDADSVAAGIGPVCMKRV